MTRTKILLPAVCAAILAVNSCGKQQEPAGETGIVAYLPAQLGETGIMRGDDVRVFVGDSLYEYIDGGAEMYHQYDFVDVATAQYRRGENEFIADIFRFADPDNAFGMFSTLRCTECEAVPFGAGGFADGPTVVFVKGEFIVNLVGYDTSPAMISTVRSAAEELDAILPGAANLPDVFRLFPKDGRIAGTEKIFAESYLGQKALSDVYAADYAWDGDTVTVFMTDDPSGEKYQSWFNQAGAGGTAPEDWPECPYDGGAYFLSDDSYYGLIIAGRRGGALAGVAGYDLKHRPALTAWIQSLATQGTTSSGQ